MAQQASETTMMSPGSIEPPHEVRDRALLAELVADMTARGWQGRPILACDEGVIKAWTGSHRIAAAAVVGIEVPVVVISPSWERWGERIEQAHDDSDLVTLAREMAAAGEIDEQAAELMAAETAAQADDALDQWGSQYDEDAR